MSAPTYEQKVDYIYERMKSKTINDKDITTIAEIQETAELHRQQETKRRQEAKEKHDAEQLEKQKFTNRFPNDWKFKHAGKAYADSLIECMTKSPLADMQAFADEMIAGKRRGEFKDPDVALNFLLIQINQRINAANPNYTAKELLAKAQDVLKTGKAQLDADAKTIRTTHEETKAMLKQLKPNDKAAKPYTI
jgi:hypothetical protein